MATALTKSDSTNQQELVGSCGRTHETTDSIELGNLYAGLSVALQHTTPNALHEATTFCTLMCVSRQLQQALQQAAVRSISCSVLLAGRTARWNIEHGGKQGHEMLSGGMPMQRASIEQLQWVVKCLEQQQLRQLKVYAEQGWEHCRWFVDRLLAAVPELTSWGLLCAKQHALPEHRPFCHSVVIDFAPSHMPPGAPPGVPLLHTHLAVGIEHNFSSRQERKAVRKHLSQLPNLLELNLHYFNPPAGSLVPVLSTLTALTKIYIRHPSSPEQQALPVTLKEVTVGREFEYSHAEFPRRLLPLNFAHLTALEALTIDENKKFGFGHTFSKFNWLSLMCEGVPAGSVLPASVKKLTMKGIRQVEPLLMLTQLRSLNISHMSSMSLTPDTLLALSQLTSVTRVNITARLRAVEELQAYSPAFDALPVDLSGVEVEQSAGVSSVVGRSDVFERPTSCVFGQSDDDGLSDSASCGFLVGMKIMLDVVLGRRPLWRMAR